MTPSARSSATSAAEQAQQAAEHFLVVLAEAGRAARHAPGGRREPRRQSVDAHLAHRRVGDRRPEPLRVRIVVDPLAGRLHGGAGHARLAEPPLDLELVALRRPRRDVLVERILVRKPRLEVSVTRMLRPRIADQRGQPPPVGLAAARDRDPGVLAGAGIDAVRRHRRPFAAVGVRLALAPGRAAVDAPVEQRRAVQRQRGLGAGQVDPLALAGALAVDQRQEDGHRHVVAAGVVHVGVAPAGRRLAGQAGGEGQSRDRLHDRAPGLERGVGADLAEAAVGDVDDVGPDRLQPLVAEPQALQHAGGEILGHAVGLGDQLGQQLLAALGAQVERDPELADIVIVVAAAEFQAAPLVDVRADAAQDVPAALPHRVLDADHLGAERGEPLGRAGARQLAAEVADAHAGQGLGRRAGRLVHPSPRPQPRRRQRLRTSYGRTAGAANRRLGYGLGRNRSAYQSVGNTLDERQARR